MSVKNGLLVLIALLLSFAPVACGNDSSNSALQATDYSKPEHWLSLPAAVDKDVDVFYLYPTAWRKVNDSDPNICEIDNASMLIGAPAAFARQATAFETVANVYAPFYRQADAAYTLSLPPDQREVVVGGIPTLDAVAAFDYYIKHYNKGRPFILAGHSQGSNVLMNILADYMKANPDVYDRMIAAYVIGYSVTDTYLANNPHLKFAEGPDDTGVIISYNTQAPDVVAGTNPVVLPGALVINPITWTRDETLATTAEGLGSFMPDPVTGVFSQVAQYADAKIDKTNGVLICSTADEDTLYKLSGAFGRGVYHAFDYSFYYYNIRDNAANRTNKFLSSGGGGCFIATAAFGSYQEPHVWMLRLFRDRFLLTNRPGQAFVRFYCHHSPPIAAWIATKGWARVVTRIFLLPLYGVAYLMVGGLGWVFLIALVGVALLSCWVKEEKSIILVNLVSGV